MQAGGSDALREIPHTRKAYKDVTAGTDCSPVEKASSRIEEDPGLAVGPTQAWPCHVALRSGRLLRWPCPLNHSPASLVAETDESQLC
jgi:hypothetical protein